MRKQITLSIQYDPFERDVQFTLYDTEGSDFKVADGEGIKEYENKNGIFSLEAHHNEIFAYISENFEGEREVAIEVNVSQAGYEKYIHEFNRFEKSVARFNKTSELQLLLEIKKVGVNKPAATPQGLPNPRSKNAAAPSARAQGIAPAAAVPSKQINIAVVGKKGSGKTELIRGMMQHFGGHPEAAPLRDGVIKYADGQNGMNWYEMDGIEIEEHSVSRVKGLLHGAIQKDGITVVVYCFHALTGKIEDIERDFIVETHRSYPNVKVLAVVTVAVDENKSREFAKRISSYTKGTKAFPVLATDFPSRAGYIEPSGLRMLANELTGR